MSHKHLPAIISSCLLLTLLILFGSGCNLGNKGDSGSSALPPSPWIMKHETGAGGSPGERYQHTMVWDGTKAIMFGGYVSGPMADTWWYDPITTSNTWTQKNSIGVIPQNRRWHSMVWAQDKAIMFGGWYSSQLKDLWWYEPVIDTWTEKITNGATGGPTARYQHSMVWDGEKVIMFGGDTGTNDLWWYYPVTNTWVEKITNGDPNSPVARYAHAMVWDGTRVIMFGGYGGGYRNDLWWYEPISNTWTEKIPNGGNWSSIARYSHTMVWDGTRVIIYGGYSTVGGAGPVGHTVYWYTPSDNTLTAKNYSNPWPSKRYYHTAVWAGNKMIIFGGNDGVNNINDLWWCIP